MRADRKLLVANKAWAKEKIEERPDFFQRMQSAQTPEFLWIGCSDSRVPAEEITGTKPGELFVHRNVGNLVVHTDLNLVSVLHFAVQVLKVSHIIVCGHYGCGGVKAALSGKSLGIINKWLHNIKDNYRFHRAELDALSTDEERLSRMVELNVIEGVNNIAATAMIQETWAKGEGPYIHGWVYSLGDGLIRELICVEPGAEVDPIYRYQFSDKEKPDVPEPIDPKPASR